MLMRKVAIAGATALAAVVLAQGVALIGARGHGSAVAEDHRVAEFRLNVAKLTSDPPRMEGSFSAHIVGSDRRGVAIDLRHLRNVVVSGEHRNVCEFGGAAVMRVRTPSGVETVEGLLAVRVADNRTPTNPNLDRPDLIHLRFTKPGTHIDYTFTGRVRQGDIDVFVRTR